MGKRAFHHYVSAGYQRYFADETRRIALYDKELRRIRQAVGVKDAFGQDADSSYVDLDGAEQDELEDKWQEVENRALPILKGLDVRQQPSDMECRAVKELAALHFARSRVLRNFTDEAATEVYSDIIDGCEVDERILGAFERDFGRPPIGDELFALASKLATEAINSRRPRAEAMVFAFNAALSQFDQTYLQLASPTSSGGLSFSDSPVVVGEQQGTGSVRLGHADSVVMPLRRDLLVAFTGQPKPPALMESPAVDEINRRTWENAVRFVGAHPNEHPSSVVPGFKDWQP